MLLQHALSSKARSLRIGGHLIHCDFFLFDLDFEKFWWAVSPFSALLTLLVLVSFILSSSRRFLRTMALLIITYSALSFALLGYLYLNFKFYDLKIDKYIGTYVTDTLYWSEILAVAPAVIFGTLTVAIATALISPFRVTWVYTTSVFVGAVISAFVMNHFANNVLNWSMTIIEELLFWGTWSGWSVIIFISMYLGEKASQLLTTNDPKGDT